MKPRNLLLDPFRTLRNRCFAKLFVSQAASLFGNAFTWLALALLSYQLSPERSASILATALSMRVAAYVFFSPFAGMLADYLSRKQILWMTQGLRMLLTAMLSIVTSEWQLYLLVFLLNVAAAFFTPTYRSVIPQVVKPHEYRQANGLSMATFQLLSVFGPALAGVFALLMGVNQLFLVSGVLLFLGVIVLFTIPSDDLQRGVEPKTSKEAAGLHGVAKGLSLLFANKILRFSLSIEFVAAIAGAMVLVNTVGLVKQQLTLGDSEYGLIMSFFGLGAAITAFLLGSLDKSKTRAVSLLGGATLIGLSTCFAELLAYEGLLFLWVLAGIGQTLADMPSETLIGENIDANDQPRVYGSHFAISHLWWFIGYAFAGFLGSALPQQSFLIGGLITLALTLLATILFKPSLR